MNFKLLIPQMLLASLTTLQIFFLTLIFSLPLGLVISFGRMSKYKIISVPTNIYILIMRGTPLMLQLMFVFYGLKPLFGIQLPRFSAAIIAFSLNYAAYFAEIYRGGIQSVPKGQYEACKVLGFTKSQTFFRIILPQVIKNIIPAMGNEFITLVKDTSLAQTIVVIEIMRVTEKFASAYVSAVPFAVAAIFYLIMNGILTKIFSSIENKLSYYN
mgnify:CR=1 FL=1